MKIKEIISEDTSAEEQLSSSSSLNANLLPVLMFLKKRAEDKELSPKLRTDSLIQLVQNAGDVSFDYHALVDAYENSDTVKELIGNFNEEEIELASDDSESSEEHGDGSPDQAHNPRDTVKAMAQKAAKNRP